MFGGVAVFWKPSTQAYKAESSQQQIAPYLPRWVHAEQIQQQGGHSYKPQEDGAVEAGS